MKTTIYLNNQFLDVVLSEEKTMAASKFYDDKRKRGDVTYFEVTYPNGEIKSQLKYNNTIKYDINNMSLVQKLAIGFYDISKRLSQQEIETQVGSSMSITLESTNYMDYAKHFNEMSKTFADDVQDKLYNQDSLLKRELSSKLRLLYSDICKEYGLSVNPDTEKLFLLYIRLKEINTYNYSPSNIVNDFENLPYYNFYDIVNGILFDY